MGTVRWICLDADDLMHENTGEANYNESVSPAVVGAATC